MSRAATTDLRSLPKGERAHVLALKKFEMSPMRNLVPALCPVDMHHDGSVVLWCMLVQGGDGDALKLTQIGRQNANEMPDWWTGVDKDCPAGRWCYSRDHEFVGTVGRLPPLPDIDEGLVTFGKLKASHGDYVLTPEEETERKAAPRCRCYRDDMLDDLEYLLGEHVKYDHGREDGTMSCGQLKWALEKGVAPCQPFALCVDRPHYTESHTQDGDEYDVEIVVTLVWIEPWPAERVAKTWEVMLSKLSRWNEHGRQAQAANEKHKAELREMQWSRPDKMAISYEAVFGKNQSASDSMDMPGALRVTLYSTLTDPTVNGGWAASLAQAQNDGGDYKLALEALAVAAGHGLTAEMLSKMPRHRGW